MSKVAYINNKPQEIVLGETIISLARRALGQDSIPTLCDAPNLDPFGSCRVCSVDVALEENGPTKVFASCHTPVAEGQFIYTDSPNIQRLRKNIIELVLTDHPLDCLTCEVNGNCELQTVAAQVGITDVRYPDGETHLDKKKDLSHPYMTSDLSKCINCYRCVRACDEVQGEFVLSMSGRGFDSHIIKGFDESFEDSPCVSCGACSQACPTAAISDVFKSKSIANTQKTRTVCNYCGVGCNLEVATAGGEIKGIQAPYDAEVNQGHTCLKGRYAFKFYDHPDRITSPMIKRDGEFEEVSWDEVYDHIATKFSYFRDEFGPDSMAGISSARCTNEENYLMQKFFRVVVGTNNIDGCARVCHSPTALGMQKTFGIGAATNSVEDIKFTEAIMVIGANPTEGHPVTGAKLKQFAMTGKTSIVIDPRRTELARYARYHIQLRPGTNVAVLNMMLYYIVKEGLADQDFITARTEGYEDFCEELLKLDVSEMEAVSGVDRELVREAAIAYATAERAMSFHGLGVTEHSQGTFTVMQIADLALITGNIGRPGVGVNPLRGQNNVQGMADMGAQPYQGPGYLDVSDPDIIKHYEEFYGVDMPTEIGWKIPQMYDAALVGKLKAVWVIGEDMVQTDPNSNHVRKALGALEMLVVQEIFMTPTAQMADVVLPGASFLEKSGTFTNGERRIQRVNQVVEPIEGSKPDGQIVVELMNHMGYQQGEYDPAVLLEEISGIVPFFAGVKWDELGDNGKQWPVAVDGQDTPILHTDTFKRGKGLFVFNHFKETEEVVANAEKFPYILTTNRNLEHYNCGAQTRRTANVELVSEDVIFIHPEDAEEHGIQDTDMVCVESDRGKVDIKAKVSDEIKKGVLSTTFHFPEIMVNDLTSSISDSIAMCPEYKVVSVRIRKARKVGTRA